MLLIRFILISLIIYLILRSFINSVGSETNETRKPEPGKENKANSKKVSKEIGEYVDYEEVD
jgi:large-conductance mechanosensitive channel